MHIFDDKTAFMTYKDMFYKYGKKYGLRIFNDLPKDSKVLQLIKGILIIMFATWLSGILNLSIVHSVLTAILPSGVVALVVIFPEWYYLVRFLAVLAEIPAVWMLLVKAWAYCSNGFDITDEGVCARYCKWYSFHSISVPFARLAEIRISQNIFQRINRSCDVHIYTASERINGHIVRSMPVADVQEIIRKQY